MYKILDENTLIKNDCECIPRDEKNVDYRRYLKWRQENPDVELEQFKTGD